MSPANALPLAYWMAPVPPAPVAPLERQVVPSSVKQLARRPPAKVEVPPETVRFPPMLRLVVVAEVPVAEVKVRVPTVSEVTDEFVVVLLPKMPLVMLPKVAKREFPTERFEVVAEVPVAEVKVSALTVVVPEMRVEVAMVTPASY